MSENAPLVTVITPTYNRAGNYLRETIDSVLAQDYANFEYIILDDGSTDDTRTLVEGYHDPRINYHFHENMGETLTVNRGFSIAHGKYIVVVNSDDPIMPQLISETVKSLQDKPDALVAYVDWQMIDDNSAPFRQISVIDYDYIRVLREFRCIPGPGAVISRRALELEKGRDPNFRYAADMEFWLRVGMHGPFVHVQRTLASHRIHSGSLTHSQAGTAVNRERIEMLDKLYSCKEMPEAGRRVKRYAYAAAHYTTATMAVDDRPRAAHHYMLSILICPFGCRPQGEPRRWWFMIYIITSALLPAFIRRPLGKVKVKLMGN